MFRNVPNINKKIHLLSTTDKKRVADWLVQNTVLSVEQIAKITNLDIFTVQDIFNDIIKLRHEPLNPIENGLITSEEIDFYQHGNKLELDYKFSDDKDIMLRCVKFDILEQRKIFSAKLIKIYYVSEGRNAWWGSWSSTFEINGSFHTSLISAKRHAEKKRVQGTVFTIEEIPAICFYTTEGLIVIASINSQHIPFISCNKFSSIKEFITKMKKIQLQERYMKFIMLEHKFNLYLDNIESNEVFHTYKSYVSNGYMGYHINNSSIELQYTREAFKSFTDILTNKTNQ